MKLIVLGSTGYHPNDLRHTACIMLPEIGVVLDAGTAMFRVGPLLCTPELHIFLSHAHLDHVIGLTYLFDVLGRDVKRRVVIHGEAEKLAAVREHLLSPLLFPVPLPCEYQPLTGPVALPQGGQLTSFALEHPGGVLGFRLDWPGRSLAYVTDTIARPESPYVDAIRDVDVLLHECYFPDSEQAMADLTGHSHTTAVAQVAQRAGVKRLYLMHLYPVVAELDPIDIDAARRVFPATELCHDYMEIEF
jgi:ribonuclease BN (tRNA processing enzyme)